MSNRTKQLAKRKKKQLLREKFNGRTVIQRDGSTTTVLRQAGPKYDVEMIRDFLENLLLEARVQHFENLRALRALEKTQSMDAACKAAGEIFPSLVEQLGKYHLKYRSALLCANIINGDEATQEEVAAYAHKFLLYNIEKRDAEIGHLEALQDMFDEALLCAKMPLGVTVDGKNFQPTKMHVVRQIIDESISEHIPAYDDIVSEFEGHWLTTDDGIESLKSADYLAAESESSDEHLLLFGDYEQCEDRTPALVIKVQSFRELQFVLAAIKKFKGVPVTTGECWKGEW